MVPVIELMKGRTELAHLVFVFINSSAQTFDFTQTEKGQQHWVSMRSVSYSACALASRTDVRRNEQ